MIHYWGHVLLEPMDQYLAMLGPDEERCKLLIGNISYNKTLGKIVRRRYKQLIIAGQFCANFYLATKNWQHLDIVKESRT